MQASEVTSAVAAVRSVASSLGLAVDDAVVLNNSNRLALRLLPGDVVARVAHGDDGATSLEVELAHRLTETGAPVGALAPQVEPRVYERDGFAITWWTYYEPVTGTDLPPGLYTAALERLHGAMRTIRITTPHFTDRIAQAQQLVASTRHTPALADDDRELLRATLGNGRRAVSDRGAAEQLLHGEPHPGNVLSTATGPLFIDLETGCRGPVEFDLAHVPTGVSDLYANVDRDVLDQCRLLVLGMVAAWRWQSDDDYPDGRRAGWELLRALRQGPPWPTLDVVMDPPAR